MALSRRAWFAALAFTVAAGACSGASATPAPSSTPASVAPPSVASASAAPSSAGPSSAAPSSAGPSSAASVAPATFKPATSVKLQFDGNAQTVLLGDNGRRIFIDVYFPDGLPKPAPGPNDILLTTHSHDDHFVADFADAFPGPSINCKPGKIELDDVKIASIDGSHDEGYMGTDNIFVIDFAGLRIVHFGDNGQTELTPEQLAVIEPGKVDVAISQTANSLSNMDASNNKGVKLMAQVQPKIFIPTHLDGDTMAFAAKTWPGGLFSKKAVTLSKSMIPAKTTMLVMGNDADFYSTFLNLQPAGW